jgi:hypothetical protein
LSKILEQKLSLKKGVVITSNDLIFTSFLILNLNKHKWIGVSELTDSFKVVKGVLNELPINTVISSSICIPIESLFVELNLVNK